MASERTFLLHSIRRWVLVIAFVVGIAVITIAHTGYILSMTRTTYGQSLVFSVAGGVGGIVAFIAGLNLLASFVTEDDDGGATD